MKHFNWTRKPTRRMTRSQFMGSKTLTVREKLRRNHSAPIDDQALLLLEGTPIEPISKPPLHKQLVMPETPGMSLAMSLHTPVAPMELSTPIEPRTTQLDQIRETYDVHTPGLSSTMVSLHTLVSPVELSTPIEPRTTQLDQIPETYDVHSPVLSSTMVSLHTPVSPMEPVFHSRTRQLSI